MARRTVAPAPPDALQNAEPEHNRRGGTERKTTLRDGAGRNGTQTRRDGAETNWDATGRRGNGTER